MRVPDENYQTNIKLFVTVNPKSACRLEFADNLWLVFLDQPQSYAVGFSIINFHIYHIILTECKHRIDPYDMITFIKYL